MQYRLAYACIISATNVSISFKSVVKIAPVTSAENRLTTGNCAAPWPQFDDRRLFDTLAFENGLEYCNSEI